MAKAPKAVWKLRVLKPNHRGYTTSVHQCTSWHIFEELKCSVEFRSWRTNDGNPKPSRSKSSLGIRQNQALIRPHPFPKQIRQSTCVSIAIPVFSVGPRSLLLKQEINHEIWEHGMCNNVGIAIINHPPNHHESSKMGGLFLLYPHYQKWRLMGIWTFNKWIWRR